MTRPDGGASFSALVPKTAALLILLYQLRFLADDLADTPIFVASLAGALLSAIFLHRKKIRGRPIRPFPALIVLILVPPMVRFLVALPRWFIPGVSEGTILLDSLLLNLDRNGFAALMPFYWTAIGTYFSLKSRPFLRADIIAADTFFLVLFSVSPTSAMQVYKWPILMIALFALVFFLQILSLVLSTPPEVKLRRKEAFPAVAFLFILILLGGIFFIRPFQEKAVERGGGLLEPKLFRFDFSQVLRLESEISVNDDLVLIVRKDSDDYHILLRRYTLSGYSPKQGFFRLEDADEAAHPQRLPNRPVRLPAGEIKNFRVTEQEYYLVNFDASAFIGMNMPVEVIPYESWDASSFNSAYAVKSHTSEALPFELIDSVPGRPGSNMPDGKPEPDRGTETRWVIPGLSPEEYALYTDYGGDKAIADLARETVHGGNLSYWEQVQLVYDTLKYGEYRYSLKPGIAPDGDQLKYFLFNSRKGYCTYYAFAFTLMLRSLGIPCRIAAGFFIDPSTEAFNYYPVRTDMAHAWAEVWFPEYGWIEYDPTTDFMAEGEEFRFSPGTPPELFERLMKEILDNHSRLRAKDGEDINGEKGSLAGIGRKAIIAIAAYGPLLAAAAIIILFLALRSGNLWLYSLHRKPRKKALRLWAHVKRRLALAGLGTSSSGAEAEWAKALDSRIHGLYPLYLDAAATRFAPHFSADDSGIMTGHYKLFCDEYSKAIPLGRRLLAWLLPPLALILKAGRRKKAAGTILLIVILFSLRGETGAQDSGNESGALSDALYNSALAAQAAENWERAVELFSMGEKNYPNDIRFPWSLGNLYYYRRLYRLAWDEYRRAEKIFSWDSELLIRLASTAGYLNLNDDSAGYLERVLMLESDNKEAIGHLAWMYFKLHRLGEGERLLLDAMDNSENDSDFAMTLGTIYSDMFRYGEAKESYLKAIKGAEANADRLLAALAHYNLSILESRFYQYGLAYDETNASLEAMNRASGKLARGELYLRRMELPRALAEYQDAYGMDSSPLSKLNLAEVFQTGGRLADGLLYANDCLKAGDHSWMLNYGIDPVRYKRDIHEVLKDTYSGLLEAEAFACPNFIDAGSLGESAKSFFRKAIYRFKLEVHTHLYRKYSLLAADAYSGRRPGLGDTARREIHLEALVQYFNAFEAYPRRALCYLGKARAFEEPLIPGSVPSYNFEEGRFLGNRRLLLEALGEFDPSWERDMIAEAYAELAFVGSRAEKQDAAEKLFAINRGALLRNGIRLPVELRITDTVAHMGGILTRAARAAGLEPPHGGREQNPPRYTLTMSSGGNGTVSCELYDGGRGLIIYKNNLPQPSASLPLAFLPSANLPTDQKRETRSRWADFTRSLRDGIFSAF